MPSIEYNIDSRLIEQFKASLTPNQVISEKNSRKKYEILDAGIASELDSSLDSKNFLVKIREINSKDNYMSYTPANKLLDKYTGFTDEQLTILKDIGVYVAQIEKQRQEQKEQERLNRQLEHKKTVELQRQSYIEQENQKLENYKRAKFLVDEVGTQKQKDAFARLNKDKVSEVFKVLDTLEPKYELKKKEEEKRENAYRVEAIDDLDEDNSRVPVAKWLILYNKAKEYGNIRDLYESRAIIVNSTLHCNAARALIYHGVGSVDKQTGEHTGKEGNRLYNICDTGDSWNGLYARYATPNEIDTYVTRLFGEEWTNALNE